MKPILLLFLLGTIVSVQAQVQTGRIEFQKVDRQAIVAFTQYPSTVVEQAINSKMEILGNKGKENRSLINLNKSNFFIYRSALLPKFEKPVDLYFKTEDRGKKDVDESVIYMLIGKGPDDFANSDKDPELIEQGKEFLKSILPHIAAYSLELDIVNQQELIQKIQGKIERLIADSVDLDKKLKNIQLKQQENSKDKLQQVQEQQRQRGLLEALKGKRGTSRA